MSEKTRINKIVKLFKKHNPKDLEELLELGIPDWRYLDHEPEGVISLRYIGQGAFRKAYRINDLSLIVKFSIGKEEGIDTSLEHTLNEIDAFEWAKSPKLKPIRKYMPKVYYTNDLFGVILMEECIHVEHKDSAKLMQKAADKILEVTGKEIDASKNFITTWDRKVILIDWGLLGRLSEWEEV